MSSYINTRVTLYNKVSFGNAWANNEQYSIYSYLQLFCIHFTTRWINAVQVHCQALVLPNATLWKVLLIHVWKDTWCTYRIVWGVFMWKALQIGEPPSFASISLSIPFAQDCGQILLHGHLLPIATVAVRENPVRVALGQRLVLFYRVASSAWRKTQRPKHRYSLDTHLTSLKSARRKTHQLRTVCAWCAFVRFCVVCAEGHLWSPFISYIVDIS